MNENLNTPEERDSLNPEEREFSPMLRKHCNKMK